MNIGDRPVAAPCQNRVCTPGRSSYYNSISLSLVQILSLNFLSLCRSTTSTSSHRQARSASSTTTTTVSPPSAPEVKSHPRFARKVLPTTAEQDADKLVSDKAVQLSWSISWRLTIWTVRTKNYIIDNLHVDVFLTKLHFIQQLFQRMQSGQRMTERKKWERNQKTSGEPLSGPGIQVEYRAQITLFSLWRVRADQAGQIEPLVVCHSRAVKNTVWAV